MALLDPRHGYRIKEDQRGKGDQRVKEVKLDPPNGSSMAMTMTNLHARSPLPPTVSHKTRARTQ